jgi:hypothetical protein
MTPGSNGGFNVAVMDSVASTTTLQWRGTWWSQDGSSGVQYINTVLTPTDFDGDSKMDLLYSTSTNWDNPSFTMGLMRNTGSGLAWGGTLWTPSLRLSETTFLPGRWSASAKQGFAYVTKNNDNGFTVAIMASTGSALQWRGSWWTSSGSSSVHFRNTFFSPADADGDGYTDLYYTTSVNWSNPGFTTALMHTGGSAGGFTYSGQRWNATGLKLDQTQFLPRG